MELKEWPLFLREHSNINLAGHVNAHALQRFAMCHRRHEDVAAVLKTDEPPVEQVIDAWCQKQSILATQPLFVRRITGVCYPISPGSRIPHEGEAVGRTGVRRR